MTLKDGQIYKFIQYSNGFYFFDTVYFNDSNTSKTTVKDYNMINIVK